MLPALADFAALSARVPGGIPAEDQARAESALEDASALVRDECGRDFLDDLGELDVPPAIVRVVLAVARRDYMNPENYSSDTETVGPHSRTGVRPDEITTCYLTEAELAICGRYRETGYSGLWTIATTRASTAVDTDTIWYYDGGGGLFPLHVPWEFIE